MYIIIFNLISSYSGKKIEYNEYKTWDNMKNLLYDYPCIALEKNKAWDKLSSSGSRFRLLIDFYHRGGRMDKTFALNAVRSGVRIPGQIKCSLRTTAVNAMVKYPLYLH